VFAVSAQGQGFGRSFQLTEKLYVTGGFGFNFGTTFSNISVAPQVGYKITERFSGGAGIIYQYNHYRQIDASLNHYGGSLFTRYLLTEKLFATTEYEYLTLEFPTSPDFRQTDRQGFNSWFVGGGFIQPLGNNTSFNLIGLYNLLHDDIGNSPYDSPFLIRMGFNLGF
jgi:hypothetical protein